MLYGKNNPAFCKRLFHAMVLTGLFQTLLYTGLGVTDLVLASYLFSVPGISAVTVAAPLSFLFSFLNLFFLSGCRVLYTQEIGRFNKESANKYFSTAMTVALILSAISLALMYFAGDRYFDLFGLPAETQQLAREYAKYYKYVYVFTPLVAFVGQMVYSDGDTKLCTIAMVFLFVGNTIFSILGAMFIGMEGIGLAKLVSGLGNLAINSIHFLKKSCTLSYRPYFSLKRQITLIRYGFLDSTFPLFFAINSCIITVFIINHFGSDYLAVNTVVGQAMALASLFWATPEAMLPILNMYRGERNDDGVRKIVKVAGRWSIIIGLVLTAVVFLASPLFPQLFFIEDPVLSEACVLGIRMVSLTLVFHSIMSIPPMYYNAAGHTVLSTAIARCKDSVLYILLFVLCGSLFGVTGMWVGAMLCPIAAALLTLALLRMRFGKRNLLLLKKDGRAITSWDLVLSTDSIVELRDQAESYLSQNNVSRKTINRVSLLIEEYFMLVLEKNRPGKKILAELTLLCGNDTELILRDNGETTDLTASDMHLTSLRCHLLSSLNEKIDLKEYVSTLSCNRSHFKFDYKDSSQTAD